MDKFHKFAKARNIVAVFAALGLILVFTSAVWMVRAQSNSSSGTASSDGELIAQSRRVEVASVSDALEQITGKRMYMSHRMQPIFTPQASFPPRPSTTTAWPGAQISVVCNGIPVNPGDIVVADSDGVAVVPRAQAQPVLALAQQMDYKEHSMYAVIEQLKSIVEAVKKSGRL